MGIVGGTELYHIDAPPASDKGRTLPFHKFTRRKRERFDLSGNSGKTLCVSLAYENDRGGKFSEVKMIPTWRLVLFPYVSQAPYP
jgi:hypothetical protein